MIVADYARLARVRESRQILTKVFGPQPPNEMSKMPPSTAFERALLQRQESTVILALTERERRHLRKSVRGKCYTRLISVILLTMLDSESAGEIEDVV